MKDRFILFRLLESGERNPEPWGDWKEIYRGGSPDYVKLALEGDSDNQKEPSVYYMLQGLRVGPNGVVIINDMFRYRDGKTHAIKESNVSRIDPRLLET